MPERFLCKISNLGFNDETLFCLTSASWSAVNIHGWEVKTFPQAFVFHSHERMRTAEPAWKRELLQLFPNASADPYTKEKVKPVLRKLTCFYTTTKLKKVHSFWFGVNASITGSLWCSPSHSGNSSADCDLHLLSLFF